MQVNELTNNNALWLSGDADVDGMVVSCRARLARNLKNPAFAAKATEADQDHVIADGVSRLWRFTDYPDY